VAICDRILLSEVFVVKWKHVPMRINREAIIAGAIFLEDIERSNLFDIPIYACAIGIVYQWHIRLFNCGELNTNPNR
jgi:hypothetical protein